MLRNLDKRLGKFPSSVASLWPELPVSMTLSREFLKWKQAPLEGQQLQQKKDKKRRKRKGKNKIKNEKL